MRAREQVLVAVVGFVGAGQLGLPMVERLLAAGHRLRVHARRVDVRSTLLAAGATVVDSPRESALDADLVVVCVFSDAQLLEVCHGSEGVLRGLRPGAVLASHVTGRTATLRALVALAPDRHIVDAPVSGTAEDIQAGRLTVLLGGDKAAVDLCTAVMSSYAGTILPLGPLGSALAVKLVNNLLFAAHSQLALAAVALGHALDVDRDTLLAAIGACSGASYAAATLAKVPDDAMFHQLAGPFLRKDVEACAAELTARGAEAPLLAYTAMNGPLHLDGSPATELVP